jgi:CelD/BcsL family acetyltransferase involved in cellulose biosynthesis
MNSAARGSGEWSSEVIRDHASLDEVRPEWAGLAMRVPRRTVFQGHAWISAYARAYAEPGRLRVVLVRRDGTLVAAAPLMLRRQGPVGVLSVLGGAVTDHTDVLVDPAFIDDDSLWAELNAAIRAESGWHVVDLPEVPPGAAADSWRRSWGARTATWPSSVCLDLPVTALSEVMDRVPGRTANTLRRKMRRVAATGIKDRMVDASEVPQAVDRLLALHRAQWAGRGGNPEHTTARYRTFLNLALEPMIADGQAVLTEFLLNGRQVAAEVDLLGSDTLSYYLTGVDPSLRERIDASCLLVPHGLAFAQAAGLVRYSFLRGHEDYKARWRPEVVPQRRLMLLRPHSPLAVQHMALAMTRARLRHFARDHAGRLLEVRDQVRSVRRPAADAHRGRTG